MYVRVDNLDHAWMVENNTSHALNIFVRIHTLVCYW